MDGNDEHRAALAAAVEDGVTSALDLVAERRSADDVEAASAAGEAAAAAAIGAAVQWLATARAHAAGGGKAATAAVEAAVEAGRAAVDARGRALSKTLLVLGPLYPGGGTPHAP